jgi:CubicO group peptidase (beta-lactamase class C family)
MQPDNLLIKTIDNLVQETYKPTEPGAAVIVVKDGETIFRKSQGMANLELDMPIEPDMVFRIGSVTKQFTAVAILMLAEQGKLALDDSISTFLPEYPTHDHLITVKHLLTHTSGIKSYTSMSEWPPLWRKDFTVQELIDFFKFQPMLSAPGKRWAYNNSGYVLLGAILEKISGQSYEAFLQQNIFEPLGMKQSYYDDPSQIIPRRAAGYDKTPDGFANTAFLSMTQPYAAGALASTVDDLVLWDSALYTERLLKQETLKQAHSSYQLTNGSSTAYGFGWELSEYAGHRFIEHGGGIHGFRARAIRIPDERVFVAVLSNNGGVSPEPLAFKIAALAMGRPYHEPTPVALEPEVLALYEGVYEINASGAIHITRERDQLFFQYEDNPRMELVPLSPTEFFFKEMSFDRLNLISNDDDAVISLKIRGRTGIAEVAKKVERSIPGTS